ncbi:zonadhesin-like [Cotesia typhae]|uniref:zonadhesin-like n=1 Tax=Cotesia typhae TaxID=2053667 RepID=UPI003D69FCD3
MLKVNSWIISLTVIVISNARAFSNGSPPDVTCALKHTLCNPNLPRPCCDSIDQCQRTWPDNYFRCIGDIILSGLGKSCELDEDCDEINHAKCSKDGKCICRMKTVKTDLWTCAPILGGFCWNDEPCAGDNVVCVKNECKCKEDVLGTHCQNDDVCNSVKFAKCSEDKVCVCTSNTTAVTSSYCAPIFNGFCWENDECVTPYSICLNNRCQCDEKYNLYNPKQGCVSVVQLNDACLNHDDCNQINHAICSKDKICECDENYVPVSQTSCRPIYGGFCSKNKDCLTVNAVCIDSQCVCKPNMVKYSKYLCVEVQLGIPCESNDDCRKISNSMCFKSGKCECKINYGEYNSTACAPLLGQFCYEDGLCIPEHSSCKNKECVCNDGFLEYFGEKCLPHYLKMHCDNDNGCKYIANARCQNDIGICSCKNNHGMVNETACAPLLEESCVRNELCAPLHSSCKNGKCKCNDGFLPYSKEKCLPHNIRIYCEEDDNCKYISNSECRTDINICVCKSAYKFFNHTTCAPLLGEHCKPNEQCPTTNSHCVDDMCVCQPGYQHHEGNCVFVNSSLYLIRILCNEDIECSVMKYAVCSSSGYCELF